MSEEVTKIIDTLCEKLGVAASILVPELAKYNIARLGVASFLEILLTTALVVLTYRVAHHDKDDFEEGLVMAIFPGIAALGSSIFTITTIVSLAGWIASPTASAVVQITSMIK